MISTPPVGHAALIQHLQCAGMGTPAREPSSSGRKDVIALDLNISRAIRSRSCSGDPVIR